MPKVCNNPQSKRNQSIQLVKLLQKQILLHNCVLSRYTRIVKPHILLFILAKTTAVVIGKGSKLAPISLLPMKKRDGIAELLKASLRLPEEVEGIHY